MKTSRLKDLFEVVNLYCRVVLSCDLKCNPKDTDNRDLVHKITLNNSD